jgi:hypothetical protein
MECVFTTIGPDLHRCTACGFVARSSHSPARIHRRCERADGSPTEEESPLARERRKVCGWCEEYVNGLCGLLLRSLYCPQEAAALHRECLSGSEGDPLGCPRGHF